MSCCFHSISPLHFRYQSSFQTDQDLCKIGQKNPTIFIEAESHCHYHLRNDLVQAYFQQNIILFAYSFSTGAMSPEISSPERPSSGALEEHLSQEPPGASCIYTTLYLGYSYCIHCIFNICLSGQILRTLAAALHTIYVTIYVTDTIYVTAATAKGTKIHHDDFLTCEETISCIIG